MKKQICMMMAAMMAAAALTGCSGGAKETAAATEADNAGNCHCSRDRSRDFCRGDHRSPGRRIHRDSGCGGGQP